MIPPTTEVRWFPRGNYHEWNGTIDNREETFTRIVKELNKYPD